MDKTINLIEILEKHQKWLRGEEGGQSANLQSANLQSANLQSANLQYADLRYANLQSANLQSANLRSANLQYADLQSANLRSANLQSANLQYADLRYANLRYANLQYADLQSAKNFDVSKWQPDLYILKSQPPKTKLVAYKFLNKDLTSPFKQFVYEIGQTYTETDNDTDEKVLCGKGLNVATLSWCKRNRESADQVIVEVSFLAKDIIAIPFATDGKFRVKSLKVERIMEGE